MPKAGDSWPLWYATIHGPPGSRLKEFLLYIPFFFSHNVSCSFLWAPPWTGYQGPRFSQSSTMKQLNIEGNLLYLSYPLPICIMRWLLGNFYSVFCYYLLNLTYLLFCFVQQTSFSSLPSAAETPRSISCFYYQHFFPSLPSPLFTIPFHLHFAAKFIGRVVCTYYTHFLTPNSLSF